MRENKRGSEFNIFDTAIEAAGGEPGAYELIIYGSTPEVRDMESRVERAILAQGGDSRSVDVALDVLYDYADEWIETRTSRRANRKTADESHNGWTNYETWYVKVIIDNDYDLYMKSKNVVNVEQLYNMVNGHPLNELSDYEMDKVNWDEILEALDHRASHRANLLRGSALFDRLESSPGIHVVDSLPGKLMAYVDMGSEDDPVRGSWHYWVVIDGDGEEITGGSTPDFDEAVDLATRKFWDLYNRTSHKANRKTANVNDWVSRSIDDYFEAIIFTTLEEDEDGYWGYISPDTQISPQLERTAESDLYAFYTHSEEDISLAMEQDPSYTIGYVAHDFWLTRNGHGAGFWDRGLGDVGDRLTESAHSFGESDSYIGDDGYLYTD